MKKNDLIKMLEGIKGNPDIKLWNGFVGDWQEVGDISPHDLIKQSYEDWVRCVKYERIRDGKPEDFEFSAEEQVELKKLYHSHEWDFNRYVTKEDIKKGYYKRKTIWLLQAKVRGKSSWDRLGTIRY